MARDEVEGHHQALDEARKRVESAKGCLQARKAAEDLWEVREVADVANAARVSAEGDADTLRASVVNMQRELEEARASKGALCSQCQQLTVLVSDVAWITSDVLSGLGAQCLSLPSNSEASVMPLFWLRSAMKVMVRAAEVYARSSTRVAAALQLTLLH